MKNLLFIITYIYESSVRTAILQEDQVINYFKDFDNTDIPEDSPSMPAFTVFGFMSFDEETAICYQRTLPDPIVLPFNAHDQSVFDNAAAEVLLLSKELLLESMENENTNTELESHSEDSECASDPS